MDGIRYYRNRTPTVRSTSFAASAFNTGRRNGPTCRLGLSGHSLVLSLLLPYLIALQTLKKSLAPLKKAMEAANDHSAAKKVWRLDEKKRGKEEEANQTPPCRHRRPIATLFFFLLSTLLVSLLSLFLSLHSLCLHFSAKSLEQWEPFRLANSHSIRTKASKTANKTSKTNKTTTWQSARPRRRTP